MAKKKRRKAKRPGRPQARPSTPRQTEGRRAEAVERLEEAARDEGPEPEGAEPEVRRPEARRPGDRRGRGAAAAGTAAGAAISNRQARKEQARRERERRLRRARRQRRTRRTLRWVIALAVIGGIAFLIWYVNTRPVLLEDQQAAAAATALGCGGGTGEIQEPGASGGHLAQGEPPPDYNSEPATSGRHSETYNGPPVVAETVSPSSQIEANLVHNLEHAYVIMYYRAEGEEALPEEAVDALAGMAEEGNKALLAPYADLEDGTSVAFTAWNKLLPCPQVGDGEVDELTTVARGFIDQYRGTDNAPEPAGG